jgi:DNA-binding NtrC family response regulator
LALLDTTLLDGSSMIVAAELTRRGVPFIICSGRRADQNLVSAFRGAVWIEKPSSHHRLLDALQDLLAQA